MKKTFILLSLLVAVGQKGMAEDVSISNASELIAFASRVNGGETSLNGKLTADIDLTGESFTRIGNRTNVYIGAFDGQGHSVTLAINVTNNGNDYKCQGLFGCAKGGASFSNLIVKGSVYSAANCAAALIGETNGGTVTISNVGCEATVNCPNAQYIGAFVGNNSGGNTKVVATNCYNIGNITGSSNVGVMGGWTSGNSTYTNVYNIGDITKSGGSSGNWGSGTCTNCYTSYATGGTPKGVLTTISSESVSSGELCYNLGSVFTQDLANETHPMLFSTYNKRVYRFGSAGSYTYSNDGNVNIGSAEDLMLFAGYVNEGQTTLNGKLTTDIDLTGKNAERIGNRTYKYAGAFDGQGHSVTLDMDITGTTDAYKCQGLFGCAAGGASFSNLIIKGSVTSATNCVAALVGEVGTNENAGGIITIRNVGCEATVSGGAYVGAFVGNDWGSRITLDLENCYNTGNITGNSSNSSVMGGSVRGESRYKNVYNTCSSVTFVSGNMGTCTNCYTTGSGSQSGLTTGISTASVASGELCYNLGSAFRQVLGEGGDAHPVLDSSKPNVYKLTVSDAGYASFVPEVNVAAIPKGVEVYVGQDNTTYLHLEEVKELPANNAFIVKAAEGNYYYNNTDAAITLSKTNHLKFYTTDTASTGSQYCLANKSDGVGFYKVQSGIMIPARKAYLQVSSPVKAFYGFDEDDATSINEALEIKNEELYEGVIFNLGGQHISKMQKGINIINGKKVLK